MDSRRSAAPVGHRRVTEVGGVGGGVSAQAVHAQSMHLLIRRIADNQCERGGLLQTLW